MAVTRPLNYKGCDLEIEKALRANMAISCYVSDYYKKPEDNNNGPREIVAYVQLEENSNYIDSEGVPWIYATPAKEPVKWIMPPEKAIPILIREGWKFDEHGSLVRFVGTNLHDRLLYTYFCFFGKKLSDTPLNLVPSALQCIIEEK